MISIELTRKETTRMKTSAKKRKRPTAKDCAKCEYNNRIKCGVDFCVLPVCVKKSPPK